MKYFFILLTLFTFRLSSVEPISKEQVEQIIHDYLKNNPEVIVEAISTYQEQQTYLKQQKRIRVIVQNAQQIFGSNSPYLGNKEGKTILVAFIDYNSPHCRSMNKIFDELIEENKDLKLVIKEYPVLGEASVFAAKAALAANKQGKFAPFHQALMNEKNEMKKEQILKIAQETNLDIPELEKDMQTTDNELDAVKNLAELLNLQALPTLIIAPYPIKDPKKVIFIPGAVQKKILQDALTLSQAL